MGKTTLEEYGTEMLDPTELADNPNEDEEEFNDMMNVMHWIVSHDYTNYVLLKTILARVQKAVLHDIQESREKCKHLWTLDE